MTTRKTWEELDITDDYLFKLIMNHKHICKRMIEKILRIKIRHHLPMPIPPVRWPAPYLHVPQPLPAGSRT